MTSSISNNTATIIVSVFDNTTPGPINPVADDDYVVFTEDDVIISDSTMFYFSIFVRFMICGPLAFMGLFTNVVNMIIFHRMGTHDSMGVALTALSALDFLSSVHSLLGFVFALWDVVDPDSRFNPVAIDFATIAWWGSVFALSSSWITIFLSVERCVCVVFPFKVKSIFTRTRTIVVVVIICLVNVAAHMPVFVTQSLAWATVPVELDRSTLSRNGSAIVFRDRIVIQFAASRPRVMFYIDIMSGSILTTPGQIILFLSVIWMVYGLHMSSKVRRGAKMAASSTNTNKEDDSQGQSKNQSNLSLRERRLVKVVLAIAVILIVCNLPRFLAVYSEHIFPRAMFGNSNKNLYTLFWDIALVGGNMNCSVNIFAYLLVNSAYRQKLKELFGLKSQESS